MPWTPSRPCLDQPCPRFAESRGRCDWHARKHEATRRPSAAERYGADWPATRARILARDPLCMLCHLEVSVEVDHVVALADGGANDETNLQGVGHRCHARKSARERALRRIALTRRDTRGGVAPWGIEPIARPCAGVAATDSPAAYGRDGRGGDAA